MYICKTVWKPAGTTTTGHAAPGCHGHTPESPSGYCAHSSTTPYVNMKNLLSLPPNASGAFHEITGYPADLFYTTADPADCKLGSGGGTAWLLASAHADEAPDLPFDRWLAREKRILLHAGGQSRRLPAYAPSGKALTPIPVFRWARGQRIDQTLLDLQLPLYRQILEKAPQNLRTLVASGDVLLRATEPLQDIPEADVVCYGLWASPKQASHHGVFLMNRERPTELDFMLQKPSTEQQAALMQTHLLLMDIGVWLLSDRAVMQLMKKTAPHDAPGLRHHTTPAGHSLAVPANYDLYSQFGCALGAHPSVPDADLAALKVAVLPLPGGEFYHYGTGEDMITSSVAIQNLVKDQRYILKRGIKPQTSVFTQNTLLANRPTPETTDMWMENACLGKGWHYHHHHIITGIPQNDWEVELPPYVCVDMVPVGETDFALRPYGFGDAFRGDVALDGTLFLGQPVGQWLEQRGIRPEEIHCTDDLQAARLFPASADMDVLQRLLKWFIASRPDTADTSLWRSLPRYSADELSARANLQRLFRQRRELQRLTLPKVAANWQRSVFYQTNLKEMARTFAATPLPLPQPLPATAPLMTRIHDAMFRSETLRPQQPEAAARFEAQAFGLLREGLTEHALQRKSRPQRTTFSDQIVWGRSSVRIDVAGGWTDTPPYSLTTGGNVVNLAIELNGQPPLQVYVKQCKEPVIVCRSIDLGAMERIETYEELQQYNKVGSPFSIPKAALTLAGFMPGFGVETFPTLRSQLEAFGCGMEITLLAAIPAGSGLGTSSILAATVLGALSDFCGLGWDKNDICNRTLVLEQLLTTGGGWQDQYGGVLPGVKLLQTATGFDQSPVARWLPDTLFTHPEMNPCHLLYYTGVTRTAKHILTEIVRGMFLNNTRHLQLLDAMKQHALSVFESLQQNDLAAYGRLVRATWEQNKALDAGTNPPLVEELCRRVDDLCHGYKLPGAGGGGFMYMIAKDPEAARRIRQLLQENPLTPNSRFVEMSVSRTGLQVSRS